MTFTIHNLWLGLKFTFSALALVSFIYLRFWSAESARAGSWKKGHQRLWKKAETLAIGSFLYLVGNHPNRVSGSRNT